MASRADAASAGVWSSRVDRGQLLRPHIRADGVMLVEGVVLKECVLTYRRADGSIFREYVPLETIEESAAGIAHLPLCLHHADEKVTPDNIQAYNVGNVGSDVRVEDGGFTRVHLAIRSRNAQKAVLDGTDELSLSYDTQVDPTPGVHPVHGAYDGIQRRRRYDHLALVDQARVGPDARIRVDGVATTVISGTPPVSTQSQGPLLARGATVNPLLLQALHDLDVRVDGVSTDEAAIALLARVTHERAGARADAEKTHKAALDAMTAERDAAKARADAAEAKVKALEDAEKARNDASDKTRLDGLATGLGIDPKAHANLDSLRRAIGGKVIGAEVPADASADYVAGLVKAAESQANASQKRGDGREAGRQVWDSAPAQGGQQVQQGSQRSDSTPRKGGSLYERAKRRNDSARSEGGEA